MSKYTLIPSKVYSVNWSPCIINKVLALFGLGTQFISLPSILTSFKLMLFNSACLNTYPHLLLNEKVLLFLLSKLRFLFYMVFLLVPCYSFNLLVHSVINACIVVLSGFFYLFLQISFGCRSRVG